MSIEAMKQALEALENAWLDASMGKGDVARHTEAITALRQAIEQAENYPPECQTDAEKTAFAFGWWKALEANRIEQAEQAQPVACIACDQAHAVLDADESKIIRDAKDGYPEGRKPRVLTLAERVSALCTYAADWKRWCLEKEAAPPPRQPWVGLTNQELVELTSIYSGAPLYCAIEAKLKEKNT